MSFDLLLTQVDRVVQVTHLSYPMTHLSYPITHLSCHRFQDDGLRDELRKKQNYISRVIVNSAQLIAEKIDRNGFEHGYDWCISCLREAGEGYTRLANEVHLAKASKFLSNKEFESAIQVFKVTRH